MKLLLARQKKLTLTQKLKLTLVLLTATAGLTLKAQNAQTWTDFQRANAKDIADWNLLIEHKPEFEVTQEMERGQLEIQHKTWLTEFRNQNSQSLEPKLWDVSKAVNGMSAISGVNLTANDALELFKSRDYNPQNFEIRDGKLFFNGNVEAHEIPTEILYQKNKASAELNMQAALEFHQSGERLDSNSFEKFSENIHKAWIISESWILDKFYQEKTGSQNSAITDLKTADGISQWVEANLTTDDIRSLEANKSRTVELEKIRQMVFYKSLTEPLKELDRVQARATLLNFTRSVVSILLNQTEATTSTDVRRALAERAKKAAINAAKKK